MTLIRTAVIALCVVLAIPTTAQADTVHQVTPHMLKTGKVDADAGDTILVVLPAWHYSGKAAMRWCNRSGADGVSAWVDEYPTTAGHKRNVEGWRCASGIDF